MTPTFLVTHYSLYIVRFSGGFLLFLDDEFINLVFLLFIFSQGESFLFLSVICLFVCFLFCMLYLFIAVIMIIYTSCLFIFELFLGFYSADLAKFFHFIF